ncbi:hypothetical protein SAY87_025675 [Trapa incisa]|uniref:Uncharacterized protein n=1 Tax=Trapa incisa TaxID=236973 RepID=A0AAN7GKW7_9MYRT|nr:hypothetical protein SAY87_025675 [Trapa incisa]
MRSGSVPGLNYTKLTLKGGSGSDIHIHDDIGGTVEGPAVLRFHKTAAGGSMIYRGLVSLSITLTGGSGSAGGTGAARTAHAPGPATGVGGDGLPAAAALPT